MEKELHEKALAKYSPYKRKHKDKTHYFATLSRCDIGVV
jgi:hypothetical protein